MTGPTMRVCEEAGKRLVLEILTLTNTTSVVDVHDNDNSLDLRLLD